MAKIYVSASYADLKPHREAVGSVLRRQGHQVHGIEGYAAAEDRPLEQCLADVGACDLYVGIMAWHYGFVPPERNPDGRSITELEYRAAVECRKPRLIFMAREGAAWPMRFVDRGERARRVRALRAALGDERLARRFDTPHELMQHVTVALARWHGHAAWTIPTTDPVQNGAASPGPLAHAPPRPADSNPDLPEDPYPRLEAYDHPAMLGGRDRELAEVERRLRQSRLVLALHAPAGSGKSSLLRAGLAPRLRAGGSPVAVEPRPGEPNLAFRLLADLFDLSEAFQLADDQPDLLDTFAAAMTRAYRLAGKPPILILDQVDDVLRQPACRQEALAGLGPLMAATAQQPPGGGGCSCRWLLCYRREFHGEVVEWLQDVLAPARAAGRRGLQALPHDLSGSDHSETWAVPAMGAPPPGEDPVQAAREAFVETIRRPLTLRRPDGSPRYDLRISDQDVERLAEVFVRARTRDATEPLVPELQVVLAHLLRQAQTGSCGGNARWCCHRTPKRSTGSSMMRWRRSSDGRSKRSWRGGTPGPGGRAGRGSSSRCANSPSSLDPGA